MSACHKIINFLQKCRYHKMTKNRVQTCQPWFNRRQNGFFSKTTQNSHPKSKPHLHLLNYADNGDRKCSFLVAKCPLSRSKSVSENVFYDESVQKKVDFVLDPPRQNHSRTKEIFFLVRSGLFQGWINAGKMGQITFSIRDDNKRNFSYFS